MARIEKTVFISYRRTNAFHALAINQDLTQHGYDVFLDFQGIASGDFERVILENIRARDHFLVLLTPSALERCGEPGDWLRREIETALDTKRNIVPLMLEGFDFRAPAIAKRLTGRLADLPKYNALFVPVEYFTEAMNRLRDEYLNVALDAVLHPVPVSSAAREAVAHQQAAAAAPPVQPRELSAEEWFERGFAATDPDEKLRCYTETIRLKPDDALAYINRGLARAEKGDLDSALKDYDAAIRLKPDYALAYNNRGVAHADKHDLDSALEDYDAAVRLKPDYALAYYNRGLARKAKADAAVRVEPDYDLAYDHRGWLLMDKGRHAIAKGERAMAIADFQKYLDLGGGVRDGRQAEVEQIIRDLENKL
jgi:tetratricopeptide (TPR) repeat protein